MIEYIELALLIAVIPLVIGVNILMYYVIKQAINNK